MIYGIIYGIFISFIFYFAVLAVRQKNFSVMWFTFYLLCLGLFMLVYPGYLQEFLRPVFANLNRVILITLVGLIYFTSAKFFRTFLNTTVYSKRIDRIILVLQWMGIGFIPMNLLPNPLTLSYSIILVGIGPIFSASISIYFRIKGIPNAGYFAAGWIIGHIALLRVFNVIQWIPGNLYLLPAGIIASILFFSIAITEQSREFHEYAHQDNLTGIANHRLFDQILTIEWNRNLRNQQPLSVIIADIDDFKAFNETYGPSHSDECLKTIARIFGKNLQRAGDLAARYGREELIAVLSDTLASEASFLAEKIRESVEALAIKHESSGTGKILTISIGTGTMLPSADLNPADLILKADEALFQAKSTGRNRVVSVDQVQS